MSDLLPILNPADARPRAVESPVRVVGIDLGTTNSTVTEIVWNRERPQDVRVRCLEVDQDTLFGVYTHFLVPSAVALYQGREWVGEGAKRLQSNLDAGLEQYRNLFLECKNDIGTRRTYHRAADGYRSAPEIGGRVLSFLKQAAERHDTIPIARVVVTVPASFQAGQRQDTIRAARLASMELEPGDLLDEPVAAFLDYLMVHSGELKGALGGPKRLLVFDFGGGTCDVAVFRVAPGRAGGSLEISPVSVSRYHRLGGGDIDRAIVHEVLIPQFAERNGIPPLSLSFEQKKNALEPALLGVAEALKIGLCRELVRQKAFAQEGTPTPPLVKRQPGAHPCRIGDRDLVLQSPSLSLEQFEKILEPFLDTDLLYARESEYRLTASVFGPVQDALDRSNLAPDAVDLCLLVGGSTLIPQVQEAVASYLPNAKVLTPPDAEAVQTGVARGAAYHALARTLFGSGAFEVVTPNRLAIRTSAGSREIVPSGARLPFPGVGSPAHVIELAAPATSILEPVQLRVEIVIGEQGHEQTVFASLWQIPAPVNQGDRLALTCRLDENQVLQFSLSLADSPEAAPFEGRVENPLANVVNPSVTRTRISEVEEDLRTGKIAGPEAPDTIVQLARDYAEIQQTEKAIFYLKQVLRIRNRPDSYVLGLMGVYQHERGDWEAAQKCYREAIAAGGGFAPRFNLALSQHKHRQHDEAASTLRELLELRRDGPTLTLAAQVTDAMGQGELRDAHLAEALPAFGGLRSIDDWEIGWLMTAA
ncbi:MAG: Hsp70 family protein, partial [Vicinamibacterales bacterium]